MITFSYETDASGFINQWSGIFQESEGFNDAACASSTGTNANDAYYYFPARADLIAAGFIIGTSVIDAIKFGAYVAYWSYNPNAESTWLIYEGHSGEYGTALDGSYFHHYPITVYIGGINSWLLNAYNEFAYNLTYNQLNMNAGLANGLSNIFITAQTSSGGYGGMNYDAEVKTLPYNSAHPAYLKIDWHTPSTAAPLRARTGWGL